MNKEEREATKKIFDGWSSNYEKDVLSWGYNAYIEASKLFNKYVKNKDSKILDAGSGSGFVGNTLYYEYEFKNLIASDISLKMLEECKKKYIYKEYYQIVLGETLQFKNNEFDAIICIGVFQIGGPNPFHTLNEFIRITKQNGYILFTVQIGDFYYKTNFQNIINQFIKEKKISLLEEIEEKPYIPKSDPKDIYKTWIYQKN